MNEQQKKIYEEETEKLLASGIIKAEQRNELDTLTNTVDSILNTDVSNTDQATKDASYGAYKETMMAYGKALSEVRYVLDFTADEMDFLYNTITRKLSYTRQDLFVVKQVVEHFLSEKQKGAKQLELSIELATWTSFLVGKYEVQGYNSTARTFMSVVEKLMATSRVFDIYNKRGEEITERAGIWISGLDEPEEKVHDAEPTEA